MRTTFDTHERTAAFRLNATVNYVRAWRYAAAMLEQGATEGEVLEHYRETRLAAEAEGCFPTACPWEQETAVSVYQRAAGDAAAAQLRPIHGINQNQQGDGHVRN